MYVIQKEIIRGDSFKYLGVIADDKPSWSEHLKEHALKPSRCCSLLYHVREFVTKSTLNMSYYSFVYNQIYYGITTWRTAAQKQVHEIKICLNNIIRTIT